MDALDDFSSVRRRPQLVLHVNALDHQHVSFQLNLADHFGRQLVVAGINLARFQRTSKSPGESAAGRGHDVIQSCDVRWKRSRRNFVVLGDFRVHPKTTGSFSAGK